MTNHKQIRLFSLSEPNTQLEADLWGPCEYLSLIQFSIEDECFPFGGVLLILRNKTLANHKLLKLFTEFCPGETLLELWELNSLYGFDGAEE